MLHQAVNFTITLQMLRHDSFRVRATLPLFIRADNRHSPTKLLNFERFNDR